MIDLGKHPIWQGSSLFGYINPFKKKMHILRFILARQYARLLPRQKFIGITGTVGKTTTAASCKEVLSDLGPVISTTDTSKQTANLDPIFNLPKTVLRVGPKVKKVILEMGIEYPGEMELWLSLVRPATAIVTAVNYAHSEFLGSIEQIAREKGKLVEQLPKTGTAILNWDDSYCRKLAERTQAEVIYFGTDPKNCHVWAGNVKLDNFQVVFELNYGVERVEIQSNFVGKHQIYPLLAAAALGIKEGLTLIKIKRALEKVKPPAHRLEVVAGHNGSVILDDSYNASPVAVEEAIDTLNYLPARRRIVVLGEMKELGSYSEKFHRQVADKIYKDKVDLVFLGRGDTKYTADELLKLGFFPERMESDLQTPQIVARLLKILAKGDLVLIKGSRGVRLDEVVKKLARRNLT